MAKPSKAREVVKQQSSSKEVYHYVNPDRDYDVKCREVYTSRSRQIHYPFRKNTGAPKYRQIRTIIYDGFSSGLPAGCLKNANTGFGFTRELNPILFALEEKFPKLVLLRVSAIAATGISSKAEICLSNKDLQIARPKIASLLRAQKEEMVTTAKNALADLFPRNFQAVRASYHRGQLARFVESHALKTALLSEEDILSVSSLLSLLPPNHPLVTQRKLLSTKQSFDRIFIEDLTTQFETLFARTADTRQLEDAWQ